MTTKIIVIVIVVFVSVCIHALSYSTGYRHALDDIAKATAKHKQRLGIVK